MAAVSRVRVDRVGRGTQVIGSLTFDASYPTGGEPLTPAELGLRRVDVVLFEQAAGYSFQYDRSAQTVIVRHGDDNDTSDGPEVEVPNASNLASVTVRFVAFGV